ncbi:MAG: 50S ribosomal protein L13 [Alkalispirochaetaceae bacterium]
MKTIFVNPKDVERKWYVIDAQDQVLGRVATKAATLLRGKHKPEFAPHQEIGDYVIIVNADKVRVTGAKGRQKMYYRHSGYLGSLKAESFQKLITRRPEAPMEHAVKGMLPKNRLGRKLFTNLKVYSGPDHPHAAQKPETIGIE